MHRTAPRGGRAAVGVSWFDPPARGGSAKAETRLGDARVARRRRCPGRGKWRVCGRGNSPNLKYVIGPGLMHRSDFLDIIGCIAATAPQLWWLVHT